jgi:hypothetical protein
MVEKQLSNKSARSKLAEGGHSAFLEYRIFAAKVVIPL